MPYGVSFNQPNQNQYCQRDRTYVAPPPPRYIPMTTKPAMQQKPQVSQNEQFFINKYGTAVVNKAKEVAKNVNCDWIDLIEVMYSESGMDPTKHHAKNGKIVGAVGLIQFTQITIDEINKKNPGLNLTKEKLIKMSTVEQLTYVQKYYEISKKNAGFSENQKLSEAELYALTFMPQNAKNEVLSSSGSESYASNKALDKNNDGRITKTDLQTHINSRLTELYGKKLNLHA